MHQVQASLVKNSSAKSRRYREENNQLVEAIQTGEQAYHELIRHYYELLDQAVKKYLNRGETYDELAHLVCQAVKRSALKFLNSEGHDFSAYIEKSIYANLQKKFGGKNIAIVSSPYAPIDDLVNKLIQIRTGEQARGELIESNMPLVYKHARRYADRGVPYDDLLQAGRLAIDHAASKFDLSRGNAFSSYAAWWLNSYMREELKTHRSDIHTPSKIQELIIKIIVSQDIFYLQHGVYPTSDQVSDALLEQYRQMYYKKHQVWPDQKHIQESLGRLPEAFLMLSQVILHEGDFWHKEYSLDPGYDNCGIWHDIIMCDRRSLTAEDRLLAKEIVAKLCEFKMAIEQEAKSFREIEIEILYTRLWQNDKNSLIERQVTLDDIGHKFGLSRERVRQIENKLCKKICERHGLDKEMLAHLPDMILDFVARAGG